MWTETELANARQLFIDSAEEFPALVAVAHQIADTLQADAGESPERIKGIMQTITQVVSLLRAQSETAPMFGEAVESQTLDMLNMLNVLWTMVSTSLVLRPEVRVAMQ